jgi:toxin FitB
MNIVDSSGWLAYFADEPNAKHFVTPLNDSASLVVPTVTIYQDADLKNINNVKFFPKK